MIDIISRKKVPPGGWLYNRDDYSIRADNYDKLVSEVRQHYDNNGIPVPGEVNEVIQEQIAQRHPELRLQR